MVYDALCSLMTLPSGGAHLLSPAFPDNYRQPLQNWKIGASQKGSSFLLKNLLLCISAGGGIVTITHLSACMTPKSNTEKQHVFLVLNLTAV